MTWLTTQFSRSTIAPRIVPFLVYLLLTGLQNQFEGAPRYWIYVLKTIVSGWLLWCLRRQIAELRWKFTGTAVGGGVSVLVLWIALDGWYPPLGKSVPWNPVEFFGASPVLAWFFAIFRLAGSSVVVPPLEEVFYRSFVYRYVAIKDFLSVPLNRFLPIPFMVTSVLFALEHREWLPGLLAGAIYQGIVIKTGRLGDAICAHAVTNFLLGLWVMARPAWHFW